MVRDLREVVGRVGMTDEELMLGCDKKHSEWNFAPAEPGAILHIGGELNRLRDPNAILLPKCWLLCSGGRDEREGVKDDQCGPRGLKRKVNSYVEAPSSRTWSVSRRTGRAVVRGVEDKPSVAPRCVSVRGVRRIAWRSLRVRP